MLTKAQLDVRATGLGASDVSGLLVPNQYLDADKLLHRKLNPDEPRPPQSEPGLWGSLCEEAVAQGYYLKRMEGKVFGHPWRSTAEERERLRPSQTWLINPTAQPTMFPDETDAYQSIAPGTYLSKNFPWLFCTPDRVYSDLSRLVEIKCTPERKGDLWGRSGTDARISIPPVYYVQVLSQMIVMGIHEADVAVLIGGFTFKYYPMKYDETAAQWIIEETTKFWYERVLGHGAPKEQTSERSDADDGADEALW